jgi:hypothetical protein
MERAVRTNLLGAILPIAMLLSSSGGTSEQITDVASLIADATSAAPAYISQNATILGRDMRVLRKGSAKWTCLPSQPAGVPSPNPMCADAVTLQFFTDLRAGKKSTITEIGVSYMLRGETGADFKDVLAKEPPPGKDWYHAGPHVMFVFPAAAAKLLDGIPQDPSSGEPYVRPMPNGNAAILVVPVAKPLEEIRRIRRDEHKSRK